MTRWVMLSLREAEKLPESWCRELFPLRFAKAERYLRPEDRLRCLGAGALLHGWLGLKEQDLRYGEHGKPYVPRGLHFSLSHSGEYVQLAAGDQPVGTDVELIQPEHLSLIFSVLTTEEREWLSGNPIERFFLLWTLKESIMKLTGLGLSLPPDFFSVLPLALNHHMRFQNKNIESICYVFDRHAFSLCTEGSINDSSPVLLNVEDCLGSRPIGLLSCLDE